MKLGELLGMGNTANVYLWGRTEVIKIFHDQENSRIEASKEAKNAEIINNLNLRAPRFSGTLEYEGKQCLLYERINGHTMLSQIAPTVSSVSYYAKQMAQVQYEMHQVRVGIQPNLKTELSKSIVTQELINKDEKQMITDILEYLPESNRICHYDFHPGNIILSSKGPIIIDWLNALVGHETADLARTSMMLQSNVLPPNAPDVLIKRELRELFHEEYLKEYLLIAGRKQEEIVDWMAPTLAYRIGEMKGLHKIETLTNLRRILNR
ncbi:Phosphotransferase enzyme family protein [Paenibacillus sp. UNCCL117]|uniref:aminoglycoside phosphotransferase family protein n=1 Tax=unclassified Paenibacillus TaxID=185978 RepID=UPI0008894D7A|nr:MULTISPECIES: aminoglycoside phosphotransferase family protein [unclassified Paenibacillus]SDD72351.1 Phosphotransferase enzyme family protein [Paenibacillus sp. cl123]SFW45708.1 Phosphotransferase enzyme family protein [Paenibacillus sp. UNCCL117]